MKEHILKTVVGLAIAGIAGALGFVWTMVVENTRTNVQQEERIGTERDRITNEINERRHRERVEK